MKNLLKERKILEVLSELYLISLIIIFPLITNKTGYFHIFEIKWYSYLIIAGIYLISCLGTILYFRIWKKTNLLRGKKLNLVQFLAILYLIICYLSAFLSPYFKTYNLWIGVGRGEGLLMKTLYVLTFLALSLFAKVSKKQILYFSISSVLLNGIALLQFIGFNPFNLYQNGIGTHNVSFMTTIGNIDFVSAMYCLLLPISFSAFIFLKNSKKEKIIHGLSITLGALMIGVINVQSGKLAMMIMLVLILPYIIKNNKRFSNFLITISLILTGYALNVFLNPVYHYNTRMLQLEFQVNPILLLYIIVILLLIIVSKKMKEIPYELKTEKYLKKYYLALLIMGIIGIFGIYLVPFNNGFLYEIHEILHGNFDDTFGTYRIFLWKRTLTLFKDYPILGTGPDTFSLRFMSRYTQDVVKIGAYAINDTAANVYLTKLVNIGIIGLLSYLSFLFVNIKRGLKNKELLSKIFLISIGCYMIQDFFNLSIVLTTPVFWGLLGIHLKRLEQL